MDIAADKVPVDKRADNLKTEVMAEWAGGNHLFRLTLATIAELEQRCNAGIGTILKRVKSDDFAASDLREIVRLGLIGGGLTAPEAGRLLDMHAYPARPAGELLPLARIVLHATMHGFEAAPTGVPKAS